MGFLKRHKKKILLAGIFSISILPVQALVAQDVAQDVSEEGTSTTTATTTSVQTQEPIIAPQPPTQSETPQSRERYTTHVQDRLINLVTNMQNRMHAAIHRLNNIIARLDTRIAKMKTAGTNTTEAETVLAQAKNSLIGAQSTLTSTISPTQALRGEAPLASFRILKGQMTTVHDLLKETHRYLKEVIILLKNAQPTIPTETVVTSTSTDITE